MEEAKHSEMIESVAAAVDGGLLPDDEREALLAVLLAIMDEFDDDEDDLFTAQSEMTPPQAKRSRKQRRRRDVKTCAWAQLLEDPELNDPESMAAKEFRQDFRLPYPFFLRLVELVKTKRWFSTGESDCAGRAAHPVEHKVWAL